MSAAQFRTMLVLTLLVSESGWGQSLSDLHLGTWGGSLKIDYELDHQNALSADGSADIDSKQRTTREGVTLRNEGFYFIDPRLAAGNLDLTFELVQDRESGSGTTDSRKARLIGYAFDSTFFEPFPYNGRLYANRTQGLANQPFSRTTTAFENRGAALRLREDSPLRSHGLPYFSANASVEQQHTREATTSVTGQTFRNEERQNNLKLDAHNGFQTADLDLRYAWDQVKNITSPQASFGSHTANLRYSQDFGPALNRRSDSNLSYFIRTGTSPSSVFAVNEALRIDHYSNLSSSYNYALTQNRTVLGTTVSQDESFQLRHQLYKNLTTTAQVTGLQQELSAGRRTSFAGQLNFGYRRNLPWGGTVSASAGRRSQLDDNRLQVAQINVTDEAQTAPSFLGAGAGFLLSQPFVTGASVVVVDTRGGQRLPTTLGTDYEVLAEGNVTRIVPLPTSAVIQAGDPLAVSYAYVLNPSIRYTTASNWISGGVDFQWIALSFEHRQSDQVLVSGLDNGLLQNLRQDKAQFDLRGQWKDLKGTASVAYSRYDSTRLAYTQQESTQFVAYRPNNRLSLAFNMDRTLVHFTFPVRQTEARSAQLTLDYYLGGFTATGRLGRRVYKDSLQATETVDEGRLGARLLYGKLAITTAFTAGHRIRGGFQASNWGLNVTGVRQF